MVMIHTRSSPLPQVSLAPWGGGGILGVGQVISGRSAHAALLPATLWHGEEGEYDSPDPAVDQQQPQVVGLAWRVGGEGVGSPLPLLRHCTPMSLGCS